MNKIKNLDMFIKKIINITENGYIKWDKLFTIIDTKTTLICDYAGFKIELSKKLISGIPDKYYFEISINDVTFYDRDYDNIFFDFFEKISKYLRNCDIKKSELSIKKIECDIEKFLRY